MPGSMKHKLVSRLLGEISITSDTQMTKNPRAESKELKGLLKVKEESEKVGLKLNIQKTKIRSSSFIPSWQIDEGIMKKVRDFIILGSKIMTDGDCSNKIKRCLLLVRKATISLDGILTSRDITLLTKVPIFQ